MNRRKGEKPGLKPLATVSAGHPVLRMIADGDGWFQAWMMQECTPLPMLAKITGIQPSRLASLSNGGPVLRAEVDALARAWSVSSAALIGTMADASLIVD
jgi:hypothetical protein